MRSKDYQTKVAHVTGFESLGDDVFHIRFYEELGELTAIIPTDEEMRNIAVITSKQIGERISSRITISIPKPDSSKNSFNTGKFGFGFMFKVKTRDFLTRESMGKLNQPGQIWSFNIKIFPVTSSLTIEEQGRLINVRDLDIWAILPENASILHLNPPPRTVMIMEKEDEDLENDYAQTEGPFKTYRAGQIAICWDLKNIKKEAIMHYIGHSPTEQDISGILDEVKDIKNSMEDLNEELRLHKDETEKNIQKVSESFVKELNEFSRILENLSENMSKQYVTMRDFLIVSLTIIGISIALYVSIMNLIG